MTRDSTPVVFAAFANNRADQHEFLRNLAGESRQIRAVMSKLEDKGLCKYVERHNATVDDIVLVFQRYRDRIVIFHYGGHAEKKELYFEDSRGSPTTFKASNLAGIISAQRSLELVVLNGCYTETQAKGLINAGVSVVIGTWQQIDDSLAANFASTFYSGLVTGEISRAFTETRESIEGRLTRKSDANSTKFDAAAIAQVISGWPWSIKENPTRPGFADKWSLQTALGGVSTGTVSIPPLLPYMADRSEQRDQLANAIDQHRERASRKPLIAIVYGDEREAHHAFVKRLQKVMLPDLLRLSDNIKVEAKSFEWTESRGETGVRLQAVYKRMAESVTNGNRAASVEEVALAIANLNGPVIIPTYIRSICWRGNEPELILRWLETWERWPDLKNNHLVLVVLCIQLKSAHSSSYFRRLKTNRQNNKVRNFVKSLEIGSAVVLDELKGIKQEHVEALLRNEAAAFYKEKLGADTQGVMLEEKLNTWLDEYFRQPQYISTAGKVPMLVLAEELRGRLEEVFD